MTDLYPSSLVERDSSLQTQNTTCVESTHSEPSAVCHVIDYGLIERIRLALRLQFVSESAFDVYR